MTTILTTEKNGFTYTIEFNGSKTYLVLTKFGCEGYFSTLRKAKNFINRLHRQERNAPLTLKTKQ